MKRNKQKVEHVGFRVMMFQGEEPKTKLDGSLRLKADGSPRTRRHWAQSGDLHPTQAAANRAAASLHGKIRVEGVRINRETVFVRETPDGRKPMRRA